MGGLLRDTGRAEKSLPWYDSAVAILGPLHDANPDAVKIRQYLRNSLSGRARTLTLLARYPESLREWDVALGLSTGAERPYFRVWRARDLLRAGRVSDAVAGVEELSGITTLPADLCYNLACVHAVAGGMSPAHRDGHLTQAMNLLSSSVAAGYTTAVHLWRDADLDPLRGRPDFQQMLADLGAAREPAPKPRAAK